MPDQKITVPEASEAVAGQKCDTCSSVLGALKNKLGVRKRLNEQNGNQFPSELKTAHKYKEVGAALGGGFIAKGASLLFAEGDARLGYSTNQPLYRIRTLGNLALAIASGLYAAVYGGKMSEAMFDANLGISVVSATELVDPLEEIVLGKQYTYGLAPQIPMSSRYQLSGVDTVVPAPKAMRSFR